MVHQRVAGFQEEWEEIRATLYHVPAGKYGRYERRIEILTVVLDGAQPVVALEHMGKVFWSAPVKQLRFRFPIEPAYVKGPVRERHHVLTLEATPD
jgi:hypothetical protein